MIRYAVRQPKTVFPDRKVVVFVTSTANLLLHPGAWALVNRDQENAARRMASAAFPKAMPLRAWTVENKFEGWTGVPIARWGVAPDGVRVEFGEEPATLRLPLPADSAGRVCLMHCSLKASGYADALVRSGDSESDLAVLKGDSRLIVRFVSDGKEVRMEFPPGAGSLLLRAVDVRTLP